MDGKKTPLVIAAIAVVTNIGIDYLNARWVFGLGPVRDVTWFGDPRFLIGGLLFIAGYVINRGSDRILRALRAPGETGYKIPRGGFYRLLSSPNYFGEILIWTGWAVATWSLAGVAFALWTTANLLPRALTNHAWYRETFPDYPRERKALFPFLL
jgi:protein-S-isoprenylcysteine O-methyltransferase Ste14